MRVESNRSFDHGQVPSALEREAPVANRTLRRLTAAFLATSLAALGVPGCTIAGDVASPALGIQPGTEKGLDNGTVGQAQGLDLPAAFEARDAA